MSAAATINPDQLPLATEIAADAFVVIFRPGGPLQKFAHERLIAKLIKTETLKSTLAELAASLAFDANAVALVTADPDPLKNGWYRKLGATGAGSWTQFELLSLAARDAAAASAASIAGFVTGTPELPIGRLVEEDQDGLVSRIMQNDGSQLIPDLRRGAGAVKVYDQIDAAVANAAAAVAAAAVGGRSTNTQALINAVRNFGFAPRAAAVLAAGDVPTITLGAGSAVSSIDGAAPRTAAVPKTDAKITYVSGVPRLYGPAFPRVNYFKSRGAYYGPSDGAGGLLYSTGYFAYEFIHTGTVFEIPLAGAGSAGVNFRVLVNGAIGGTASVIANTDDAYYARVAFAGAGTRRIRIETLGLPANGVHVASGAEIQSVARAYPTVTLIGDSFVEGSGAEVGDLEAIMTGRALGFNCALGGVGGTGMILPGGNNTAGFPKTNFTDATRLLDLTLAGVTSAQDASAADPKLGVVFGTMNDQGLLAAVWGAYGATLKAAIANRTTVMIDAWVAARPGKPLVFYGPTWPSGPPNNRPTLDVYRIRDGIAEAAWGRASDNVWFIDRMMPHKREGVYSTGADQAFLYTGGLAGTDPTHPTPDGHRYDGLNDAARLRGLILSEFG